MGCCQGKRQPLLTKIPVVDNTRLTSTARVPKSPQISDNNVCKMIADSGMDLPVRCVNRLIVVSLGDPSRNIELFMLLRASNCPQQYAEIKSGWERLPDKLKQELCSSISSLRSVSDILSSRGLL